MARRLPHWTAQVQPEGGCNKVLENIKCSIHLVSALELLSNFLCTPMLYFPVCLPGFLGFPFLNTEVTRVLLILQLPTRRLLSLRLLDRLCSSHPTPDTVTAVAVSKSFARCAQHFTVSISFISQPLWEVGITNEDEETEAWERLHGLPWDYLAEKWQS